MGHFWDIMISLRGQIVKIGIIIPDPESAIEIGKRFHCDQNLSELKKVPLDETNVKFFTFWCLVSPPLN